MCASKRSFLANGLTLRPFWVWIIAGLFWPFSFKLILRFRFGYLLDAMLA